MHVKITTLYLLRSCALVLNNGDSLGARVLLSKHFSYIFISTRMCFDSADTHVFNLCVCLRAESFLVYILCDALPMEHAASTKCTQWGFTRITSSSIHHADVLWICNFCAFEKRLALLLRACDADGGDFLINASGLLKSINLSKHAAQRIIAICWNKFHKTWHKISIHLAKYLIFSKPGR
jgi:hypothetical protein